jgi:23S rRNA (cytosine1962-C5)-methyltransferase
VDLYGRFAVMATYAEGLERIADWVAEALRATTELTGIVRRKREGDERLELVWGRLPSTELLVEEHGVRLRADLEAGQKTGLFLDHRENRRFVGGVSAGRRVLNLFSYTGAFSLHAALGGATHVTSVDVAAGAMDAARENFRLNGLDADAHEFVVADVFEFLEQARQRKQTWDLVISDPPSFARQKQQQKQALRAYAKLNSMGFRVTEIGGLYAAASCTSQVGPDAFRQTLVDAAARVKRRLQIVHEAGQPADHPVLAQHVEGRYLKFVVGRILAPA